MTAELCQAVTGDTNAAELLHDLIARDLFVVELDGSRGWYRYHHLVSDLLRVRLDRHDPHRRAEILRRAATWCEEQGDHDHAVSYLVRAGDPARFARFARRHMPRLLMHGQIGRHRSWLSRIPKPGSMPSPTSWPPGRGARSSASGPNEHCTTSIGWGDGTPRATSPSSRASST